MPEPSTSCDTGQEVEPAIVTQGLTRRFGQLTAVSNLSLRVPRGSVYGFLGLNGAGKSTTIRMLLGLLRPTSGTMAVLGMKVPEFRMEVLDRLGALVEAPSVYSHLTGIENLEATRRLLKVEREAVARVLKVVGLSDDGHRLVREYSTGMRQRLGLALALIGDPELLILDEPTNGLDPCGIQEVRDLVRDLPGRLDVTVFLSSHILAEVEQVASHVGIIHRGRLIVEGALETILKGGLLVVGVRDPKEARELLAVRGWASQLDENGNLRVEAATEEDAERVNILLVNNGQRVFRIAYERTSLENVFLEAIRDRGEGAA